jgi:MoaA/NifB/PqqE/SkfB family radical SAM enzyme
MIDADPDKPSANLKTIRQFIKFANKLGVRFLGVSGGEPLEHPQFFLIMETLLKEMRAVAFVLMSNGRFLEDDHLTAKLAKLQKKRFFGIQISAINGLYPHAGQTIEAFERQRKHFDEGIGLVDKLTVMTRVGRAAGKDWSHLEPLYHRKVTNCFNLIINANRAPSLKELIRLLEIQTKSNFCKPMVDPHGNVHVGESPFCSTIGTIWESQEVLFKRLRKTEFCGHCGDPVPFMSAKAW